MSGEKRLSAAEVVARLKEYAAVYQRAIAAAAAPTRDRAINTGAEFGFSIAARLVEQHLVPQWQAEPTGECVCYIRGCFDSLFSIERTGNGRFVAFALGDDSGECIELNGRPVCPISGPPSDEKGGA